MLRQVGRVDHVDLDDSFGEILAVVRQEVVGTGGDGGG